MQDTSTIEIRLPAGRELDDAQRETLRRACEALADLAAGPPADVPAQVRAMTAAGWQVKNTLQWVARAERDRDYEEARGDTPGQALCRLCQLLGLHDIEGCP
jgi:hypothetical protein